METYSNTTDSNRIYGKDNEIPAAERFCKNKPIYFKKTTIEHNKINKADVEVFSKKTNELLGILSIKCSKKYLNGAFPKSNLVPENISTHILFENKNFKQYLILFELLKNFIKERKAKDNGEYYVIQERDLKYLSQKTPSLFSSINSKSLF